MAASPTYKLFPNDPLLVQFLRTAKRCAGQGPYIHDGFGFERSYNELLGDVLRMRDLIREKLPASAFDQRGGVLRDERPYTAVLPRSGYEFLVAFFATRVLGGASVPFGSGVLPEEAQYFIETSKPHCLLVGKGCSERADKIMSLVRQRDGHAETLALPIPCDSEPLKDEDIDAIDIDETVRMNPQGPGLVIFTSGTTGPPKGVVLPRQCMTFRADAGADPAAAPGRSLCFRPPHWLGGAIGLIYPVLMGKHLHVVREQASVAEVWDVFLNNRITGVGFTPGMLRQMREYVESKIEDEGERQRYLDSFKGLGVIGCAGAIISPSLLRFWTTRTGLAINNVYGGTEIGGFGTQKLLDGSEHTSSIGVACPGIKVKLSEGDHGEIHVKSPYMFTHYLDDEERTNAAFDEEGYFKTGDLAELKDGEYIFAGRANADYIFFHIYHIPAVQVEIALTALPYVAEACVLGVPDHEVKELCAAVVRLTHHAQPPPPLSGDKGPITLARLRSDLSSTLPTYMLPTLLRVLAPGEEMPQTVSQKPIKRRVVRECFGVEEYWSAERVAPGVQFWGNTPVHVEAETRPWDWCGLQRADYQAYSM